MRQLLILALSFVTLTPPAFAKKAEILPGPVPAIVEKVVDGDTVAVKAHIWVGQNVRVIVRIDGVDTPELSGRCNLERVKARNARKFVSRKVAGRPVTLTQIRQGKYAGRVVAKITTQNGEDLGNAILKTGHGKPYKNRRYTKWCCKNGRCETDPTRISKIKKFFKF